MHYRHCFVTHIEHIAFNLGEERTNYSYYLKKLYNDRYELQAAEAIGEARGIEKGEAIVIEKIAINMLKQNLDFKLISSITGFSIDELLKLKNRL